MTRWFIFEWGKPTRQKSHQVILRSPLSRIYYYQNKQLQVNEFQYLIPTYSWTLTQISNWTCFVVIVSHFRCTWLTNRCADPSTRLNYQLGKDVSCKVLQFITRWRSRSSLVTKPYDTNTTTSLRETWTRAYVSSSQYTCEIFLHLVALAMTTFKTIFIYV